MEYMIEMRRCLEECDAVTARKLWAEAAPHLPQPASDEAALATLHHARTQVDFLSDRQRFYSHRWLLDHELPSGLPDHLKPSAERMYPKTVGVVGISVNSQYPAVKRAIQGAMEAAVLEAYADGHGEHPDIVRARMMEARAREKRGLVL